MKSRSKKHFALIDFLIVYREFFEASGSMSCSRCRSRTCRRNVSNRDDQREGDVSSALSRVFPKTDNNIINMC